MTTPTQKQRDAYRYALEDAGVPEVYAFMAARNLKRPASLRLDFSDYIFACYIWRDTPEGVGFWSAIYDNCKELK